LSVATQTCRGIADDHPQSRPPATALWARVQAALLPPTYTTIRDTTVVPSWHLAGIAHRNADGDHRFTPRATERLADTAFRFGVHLVFISSIAAR